MEGERGDDGEERHGGKVYSRAEMTSGAVGTRSEGSGDAPAPILRASVRPGTRRLRTNQRRARLGRPAAVRRRPGKGPSPSAFNSGEFLQIPKSQARQTFENALV
jgi:hypothetical protein